MKKKKNEINKSKYHSRLRQHIQWKVYPELNHDAAIKMSAQIKLLDSMAFTTASQNGCDNFLPCFVRIFAVVRSTF